MHPSHLSSMKEGACWPELACFAWANEKHVTSAEQWCFANSEHRPSCRSVDLLSYLATPLMQPPAMTSAWTLSTDSRKKDSGPLHSTPYLPVVLHMHQLPWLQALGKPEASLLVISVLHPAVLVQD